MFEQRLQTLRSEFDSLGVDTVWIMQPENRRYLSGFKAADGQLTESSGSLLISLEKAVLLTDSRYTTQAEQEARGFEIITYREGVVSALPEAFDRLRIRRLGFEAGYVIWELHQKAMERGSQHSPAVELVPLSSLVEDLREIKEPQEVEALSRSAKLMSAVLAQTIEELRPGQVERDVAWRIETMIREYGADGAAFPPIVASGPNGALPHAVPSDRMLREGEPIILDVGAIVDGYCSDMTRTVFLGKPMGDFDRVYNIVRETQLAAVAFIRPGIKTADVDSIAREIINKAGFGDFFGHSLGHGVGLATHESPAVGPLKPKVLRNGMVFTIEPGIYLPGKGGVRLEQMVTLQDGEVSILTGNDNFYSF